MLESQLAELQKLKSGQSGKIVTDPMIVDKSFVVSFEETLIQMKEGWKDLEEQSLSLQQEVALLEEQLLSKDKSQIVKVEDGYSVSVTLPSGHTVLLQFDIEEYLQMRLRAKNESRKQSWFDWIKKSVSSEEKEEKKTKSKKG